MLEELKKEEQNWSNPFKNISLTPYRLIAAGEGAKNVEFPDGTKKDCTDIKKELHYPQLYAWNLEGKALLESVEYLNNNPKYNYDLVVDSGAYSAWSRNKKFDVDEYINFLNSNKVIETAFWVAEADVIPGSFGVDPTEEERLAAPEKSWENYLYMIKRVKWPKKVVPIFHQGEDFKHLKRMLEYRFEDGDFIPYIGISPRNDVHVGEKTKWYEKVWKFIYEECSKLNRDIPATHNFGMTTIAMMEQYPSCSSDSTSWIRSASFGNIMIVVNGKIKTTYVSNRNELASDHIKNQPQAVKDSVKKLCEKIGHGITLDALMKDDNGSLRIAFNLYALNEWKQSFKYVGTQEFKEDLW
jgi:hypothetical protein